MVNKGLLSSHYPGHIIPICLWNKNDIQHQLSRILASYNRWEAATSGY